MLQIKNTQKTSYPRSFDLLFKDGPVFKKVCMPEICTDKRMASLFGNRRCQTSLLLNLVQHQTTTREPCRLAAKTGLKTVYNHSDGWSSLVLLQFSMFLFGHNCVLVHNLEIYAIRNKARVLTLHTLTQSGNNKYCQTRRRKLMASIKTYLTRFWYENLPHRIGHYLFYIFSGHA